MFFSVEKYSKTKKSTHVMPEFVRKPLFDSANIVAKIGK